MGKTNQQEFQVTLARRFHGKLDEEEEVEITEKLKDVSVSKNDKDKKNKRVIESSSEEEEVIESSRLEKRTTQTTAIPSEISFAGAVTSTQILKKNSSSKRSDNFEKPLPKRVKRSDPV